MTSKFISYYLTLACPSEPMSLYHWVRSYYWHGSICFHAF